MEMSPAQQAILLLAQNYFVNTDRSEETILVITDDMDAIKNKLKSIGYHHFRLSSYVGDSKQNFIIVSFNY